MSLSLGIQEPLHPSGLSLTEFQRRLCRLYLIGHEAKQLICSALRTIDRKRDTQLMFTLQHYALILICRFLEIWKQFQALAKTNHQIRDLASAMSIYVDRIQIWPGLKEYRNWIIAHNYQLGSNPEFLPPWVVLHTGRVPANAAEWLLLLDCVRFAVAGVMAYYADIVRGLDPVLDPGLEPPLKKGVKNDTEAQAERVKLAIEGDNRLEELGVDLCDPVFQRFKCRPLKMST